MTVATESLLGIGLYTPAEAALYARVHVQTMNRWLFGDRRGEAVLTPQLAGDDQRFVTFLDFVQSLSVRQIRIDLEVPLPKIRQAINNARERYGVDYPLAMDHTTYLYGGELIIRQGRETEEEYTQISGKEAHHKMIQKVVRVYMKDLTFDPNGLANNYTAYTYEQVKVSMNPHFRFGEPLIRSCGHTARLLWESARAEGSVEAAAAEYGITPDEVEAGYRYYESLQIPRAA